MRRGVQYRVCKLANAINENIIRRGGLKLLALDTDAIYPTAPTQKDILIRSCQRADITFQSLIEREYEVHSYLEDPFLIIPFTSVDSQPKINSMIPVHCPEVSRRINSIPTDSTNSLDALSTYLGYVKVSNQKMSEVWPIVRSEF